MKHFFSAIIIACLLSVNAFAYTVNTGVMSAFKSSEYKGMGAGFADMSGYKGPIPMIGVDSELFYIAIPAIGVHAYKNDFVTINFYASYLQGSFDPEDSSDPQIKLIDKRDSTLGVGTSATLKTKMGEFSLSVIGDVLNENNSVSPRLAYKYNYMLTPRFIVAPGTSVAWFNAKHNDYYYGVSEKEAERSGFDEYHPSDDWDVTAGLSILFIYSKSTMLMLSGNYRFLMQEVKNSPIVDASGTWSGIAGIMIKF